MTEKTIDALIQAGWDVLAGTRDQSALLGWRKQAYDCVSLLVGSDDPYAECLRLNMQEVDPSTVVADVGILTAAKLWKFRGVSSYVSGQADDFERQDPAVPTESDLAPSCDPVIGNL